MMMSVSLWNSRLAGLVVFAGLALTSAVLDAADRPARKAPADAQEVELFRAIDDGKIGVKVIMKDAKQGRLLIENKMDQPLNVKLPEAFGASPILAQQNNRNNNNQNQQMGGGMMGGGNFYVAPEKVAQAPFPAVCLEHGKPEPRPNVPYEIKPIDKVTDKAAVHELCRMLGNGQVSQRAAQVAVWHLNNDMSWQELAAKRLKFANGTTQPYFSAQEIQTGMRVVAAAAKMVEARQQSLGSTAK